MVEEDYHVAECLDLPEHWVALVPVQAAPRPLTDLDSTEVQVVPINAKVFLKAIGGAQREGSREFLIDRSNDPGVSASTVERTCKLTNGLASPRFGDPLIA